MTREPYGIHEFVSDWYRPSSCMMCSCPRQHEIHGWKPHPKPKLTTVWEGNSLDILARESIEGLTKHQPKGKSRYGR